MFNGILVMIAFEVLQISSIVQGELRKQTVYCLYNYDLECSSTCKMMGFECGDCVLGRCHCRGGGGGGSESKGRAQLLSSSGLSIGDQSVNISDEVTTSVSTLDKDANVAKLNGELQSLGVNTRGLVIDRGDGGDEVRDDPVLLEIQRAMPYLAYFLRHLAHKAARVSCANANKEDTVYLTDLITPAIVHQIRQSKVDVAQICAACQELWLQSQQSGKTSVSPPVTWKVFDGGSQGYIVDATSAPSLDPVTQAPQSAASTGSSSPQVGSEIPSKLPEPDEHPLQTGLELPSNVLLQPVDSGHFGTEPPLIGSDDERTGSNTLPQVVSIWPIGLQIINSEVATEPPLVRPVEVLPEVPQVEGPGSAFISSQVVSHSESALQNISFEYVVTGTSLIRTSISSEVEPDVTIAPLQVISDSETVATDHVATARPQIEPYGPPKLPQITPDTEIGSPQIISTPKTPSSEVIPFVPLLVAFEVATELPQAGPVLTPEPQQVGTVIATDSPKTISDSPVISDLATGPPLSSADVALPQVEPHASTVPPTVGPDATIGSTETTVGLPPVDSYLTDASEVIPSLPQVSASSQQSSPDSHVVSAAATGPPPVTLGVTPEPPLLEPAVTSSQVGHDVTIEFLAVDYDVVTGPPLAASEVTPQAVTGSPEGISESDVTPQPLQAEPDVTCGPPQVVIGATAFETPEPIRELETIGSVVTPALPVAATSVVPPQVEPAVTIGSPQAEPPPVETDVTLQPPMSASNVPAEPGPDATSVSPQVKQESEIAGTESGVLPPNVGTVGFKNASFASESHYQEWLSSSLHESSGGAGEAHEKSSLETTTSKETPPSIQLSHDDDIRVLVEQLGQSLGWKSDDSHLIGGGSSSDSIVADESLFADKIRYLLVLLTKYLERSASEKDANRLPSIKDDEQQHRSLLESFSVVQIKELIDYLQTHFIPMDTYESRKTSKLLPISPSDSEDDVHKLASQEPFKEPTTEKATDLPIGHTVDQSPLSESDLQQLMMDMVHIFRTEYRSDNGTGVDPAEQQLTSVSSDDLSASVSTIKYLITVLMKRLSGAVKHKGEDYSAEVPDKPNGIAIDKLSVNDLKRLIELFRKNLQIFEEKSIELNGTDAMRDSEHSTTAGKPSEIFSVVTESYVFTEQDSFTSKSIETSEKDNRQEHGPVANSTVKKAEYVVDKEEDYEYEYEYFDEVGSTELYSPQLMAMIRESITEILHKYAKEHRNQSKRRRGPKTSTSKPIKDS